MTEHIEKLIAKWPAEAREEYEERLAIILADGIPMADAMMTAFACVGERWEQKK
jgi:hypothetical protein